VLASSTLVDSQYRCPGLRFAKVAEFSPRGSESERRGPLSVQILASELDIGCTTNEQKDEVDQKHTNRPIAFSITFIAISQRFKNLW